MLYFEQFRQATTRRHIWTQYNTVQSSVTGLQSSHTQPAERTLKKAIMMYYPQQNLAITRSDLQRSKESASHTTFPTVSSPQSAKCWVRRPRVRDDVVEGLWILLVTRWLREKATNLATTCLIGFLVMKLGNLRCCDELRSNLFSLVRQLWLLWLLLLSYCVYVQESLAQMRAIDDKIIYKLNTSIPTQSFSGQVSAATQCKQLYDEVRRLCPHMLETG